MHLVHLALCVGVPGENILRSSFLSLSLCRYGDKTPKSVLARLFAVMWILIGVTVCSVMTATLTDALTSVKNDKYDVTTGKRVGSSI